MYIGNNASPILKINLIIQDNNQECSLNIVQVQVEYILDTYMDLLEVHLIALVDNMTDLNSKLQ